MCHHGVPVKSPRRWIWDSLKEINKEPAPGVASMVLNDTQCRLLVIDLIYCDMLSCAQASLQIAQTKMTDSSGRGCVLSAYRNVIPLALLPQRKGSSKLN